MRVIARLDVKNGRLIKTINLEGLRQLGPAKDFALDYMNSGVDEIFLSDPVASLYSRDPLFDLLDDITDDLFIPITISGGISSVTHMKELFARGADKISLNTSLVTNINLLDQAVDLFGSQSVAVSIQARYCGGNFHCFYNCGRDDINIRLGDWIRQLENRGAGEFILTSIDHEGLNIGIDTRLLDFVLDSTDVPVSYSGGVGSLDHLNTLANFRRLSGICLAGSLHYKKLAVFDVKQRLQSISIPVRPIL